MILQNETQVFYNSELNFSKKSIISKGFNTNKTLFGDFDHDGDLDMMFLNDGMNAFLRNNSDGTFTDNSDKLNIKLKELNSIDGDISDFDIIITIKSFYVFFNAKAF